MLVLACNVVISMTNNTFISTIHNPGPSLHSKMLQEITEEMAVKQRAILEHHEFMFFTFVWLILRVLHIFSTPP